MGWVSNQATKPLTADWQAGSCGGCQPPDRQVALAAACAGKARAPTTPVNMIKVTDVTAATIVTPTSIVAAASKGRTDMCCDQNTPPGLETAARAAG